MIVFVYVWGRFESGLNSYDPKRYEDDGVYFSKEADNGYTDEDREKLTDLMPGDIWKSEFGNHWIFRLS